MPHRQRLWGNFLRPVIMFWADTFALFKHIGKIIYIIKSAKLCYFGNAEHLCLQQFTSAVDA